MNTESYRKQTADAGKLISEKNLTLGTWGNISIRIPENNQIAITPSGKDYETLRPEDIPVIDFQGHPVEGELKPSSEFPLHLSIYQNRQDIQALVHTHSEYATAFALARKEIPAAAEDMIQICGGNVRVSKYALPGSLELAQKAVTAMKDRTAVLLANHGLIAGGRNIKEALNTALIVEKAAKEAVFASIIGGVYTLSDEDIQQMRGFYLNVYQPR